MNAKILIADDESDIVSMLGNFFESKGFRVLPAFNGAEALKQVEKQPDIILLDINMPGTDGLEVCKRIRDHISCPILFLTARIEDTDKVKGFAVGGDDYIVKPFSLVELDARVRAHLRREARHNFEAQVKFSGDLTIDYSERCLFFNGKRVGLAKKEFDIVELLSQNPGQNNHSEHFGLGLYICKLLCEHHNGYLKIENTATGANVSAYFKSPAL